MRYSNNVDSVKFVCHILNVLDRLATLVSPNSRNESEKVLGICDAIKCPPRFSEADSYVANI